MGNVLKRDMENVLKRDTHGEGSCVRFVLFLRECGMQEWMGRLWSLTDGYGLSLCFFKKNLFFFKSFEKKLFYFFFLACGIQVWDVRTIMVPEP